MTDIAYARPRVRGPKLLLTAAVAVTLAVGMLTMAGSTANAGGNGNGNGNSGRVSLGAAGNFAILSAAPGGGGAVTCSEGGKINGNVGSTGLITPGDCTIIGSQITGTGVSAAVTAFNSAYAALALRQCTPGQTITTEAFTDTTLSVNSGVTCFPREVTFTRTTLTLTGNGPWLLKIGGGTDTTGAPTGALTGTNLNVVGGNPCDVTWWVRTAATMTTSNASGTHFKGTILAGAAITVSGAVIGTFDGRALAKAAVTIKGGTLTACIGGGNGNGDDDKDKHEACNQGVGNGPEDCDPGNSNQGDDDRSNDENGGTPGHPGRQGGNDKND